MTTDAWKTLRDGTLFSMEDRGVDTEYSLIGTDYLFSAIDHVWYGRTDNFTYNVVVGGIEEILANPDTPVELLWRLDDLRKISEIEYKFGIKK